MERTTLFTPANLAKDLLAGVIVFLVALPLCLGIALASGAPLFSGIVAGIVGGIVVGLLSGSHTSVSGPAAGLTAIVATQIATLGSFEALLLATMVGGLLQVGLGVIRAGALSAFFPSSVIKGLLAAIGVILIVKQIPYLLGYNMTPMGELHVHPSFFRDVGKIFKGDLHYGSLLIGLLSLIFLMFWERNPRLKKSLVPAPLLVVILGVILIPVLNALGSSFSLAGKNYLMVQVPVAESMAGFLEFLRFPDFSRVIDPAIYFAGVTIALVASLETLLNLDAVDKLDKKQRISPPSRELLAQGVGNLVAGFLGGLPVTAVVIRGSVNVNAGAQTKVSAIFHGVLLLFCVMLLPTYLNQIPLSCLAAILLMTGFKLASSKLVLQMWSEGRPQFLPFMITLVSIVLTDLLIGIMIGLGVSLTFILYSNLRRPIRRIVEKHVGGEVLHIELANQVSFLNRAALENALREAPRGSHILLDARHTDYIDPDILSLIREFRDVTAPVYDVRVSLRGFRDKYQLEDDILFYDFSTQELQQQLTPDRVLKILQEGNERFCSGHRMDRDLTRQRRVDARHQHPMAIIFSGMDSRSPGELIFDLGLGDVFSVRISGTVTGPKVYGSMEYGCVVGGAKLIVVMGHTCSNVVEFAIEHACSTKNAEQLTGCPHLEPILLKIQESITPEDCQRIINAPRQEKEAFFDEVARRNVIRSVNLIANESPSIRRLISEGRLAIVGAMYDVVTGKVDFLLDNAIGLSSQPASELANI